MSYEEYQQLQNSISTVLGNILDKMKATAPPVSQNGNGSMKRKPAKALAEVSQ